MLEVQNRNWKVIKEYFAVCKHNFNMKAILEASKQSQIRYRLSPVIPMDEILSYYEAQLLTGVITIKEGLLIKLVISLASRQTSSSEFHVIPVPMPHYEKDRTVKCRTEAPYLAISEDNMETAVLTEYDMKHCISSSRYHICHEMIATETGHRSCLALLFLDAFMFAIIFGCT